MMQLPLSPLPVGVRSIYKSGKVPARMAFASPPAAKAVEAILASGFPLIVTDFYRAPAASLVRRQEFEAKGGPQLALAPGFSAHNTGDAFDGAIAQMLRETRLDKLALDRQLARFGFFCHRQDGRLASESWHYNFLGVDFDESLIGPRSSDEIEASILRRFGPAIDAFRDPALQRKALDKRKIPTISEFQKRWGLSVDGVCGPKTRRTLAFVSAEIVIVPLGA